MAGLSDAAAVPLEAVEEEAKGPNPFALWIEFIRSSVLGINDFYKGEREWGGNGCYSKKKKKSTRSKVVENHNFFSARACMRAFTAVGLSVNTVSSTFFTLT